MSTPETTPRLSDLIREGLALPEVVEDRTNYIWVRPDGTVQACALGMAYYALARASGQGPEAAWHAWFERRQTQTTYEMINDLLDHPLEGQILHACPVASCPAKAAEHLIGLVDHLHLAHDWPAQRIASWLDETVYADSAAVRP